MLILNGRKMTFSKVHFSGFATVKIVWMWTLWQELPNLKIDLFWGDINNNRNFKPIGSSKSQIFGCWTSTYNLHSNKKLKIEFATTVHNKYFSTTKSEALTKYTNLLDHKMEITSLCLVQLIIPRLQDRIDHKTPSWKFGQNWSKSHNLTPLMF